MYLESRIVVLSFVAFILWGCGNGKNIGLIDPSADHGVGDDVKALANATALHAWEQIKSVEGDATLEEPLEYWALLGIDCAGHFNTMLDTNDEQEFRRRVRDYLSRFGTEGYHADIRWAMADPNSLLPDRDPHALEPYRRRQRLIAEEQVKAWFTSDDPFGQRFQRYYHLTLWSRRLLGGIAYRDQPDKPAISLNGLAMSRAESILEGLKPDDPDCWLHARNAIILMYATHGESHLTMAEPAAIRAAFEAWRTRLVENPQLLYFRPDQSFRWSVSVEAQQQDQQLRPLANRLTLPAVPLPDWKATRELDPVVFSTIIEYGVLDAFEPSE